MALTVEQAGEALRLTRAGTTVGTIEYAAPEQLSQGRAVSAASDVYSLGVLTYEMFTGDLPRGNFDPPSLCNPKVDAAFDSVVLRALQTDPVRRYADAGAFREAFLHAADRPRQQGLRDEAVRRKMVRRTWIAIVLATVSVVTGGSAVLAWRARQEAETKRAAAESAGQRMAGLFQFLLTDLRSRLEPTGNLGAMDSVMEKAVEHFRRQYEEAGQTPEAGLKLADVLVTKAQVIGVRGKIDAAELLHTEALNLCEQARRTAPDQFEFAMRVFKAVRDRAEFRRTWENYREAMEDAQRMLAEAGTLVQRHPSAQSSYAEVEARIALAAAYANINQQEDARQQFLHARSLLTELAAALLDPLPPADREQETAKTLRSRLTQPAAHSPK